MDEECIHLLSPEQCGLCRLPPGVPGRGYRTSGGYAYHRDPECQWLRIGQARQESRGRNPAEVSSVDWASIAPGTLEPCRYCCRPPALPDIDLPTLCDVPIDDRWLPATLRWEPARRPDGH